MSEYLATVVWERRDDSYVDKRYSRAHRWEFDGGLTVPASASPHVVKVPLSDPAAVDPEEALVASIASCHLLSFLWVAARRGYRVDSYRDEAVGVMAKNVEGRLAITRTTLRPHTVFSGESVPTPEIVREMHDEAHHECFIATSVRTDIVTEPTFEIVQA
jgi:organic hydroperoxide reductase OsmC/OhrA